ncbi:MAG TPA: histidine kinase [Pyrinomonadaceae bacterium]|jgi:signal transduction histidine kinase
MATAHETVNETRKGRRARVLRGAAILGVWLGFALLNWSQLYLGLRLESFPVSAARLLGWELLGWLPWALLTLLVLRLSRRFPFERARWPLAAAVHLSASVLMAAAHLAYFTYVTLRLQPFGQDPHPRGFWESFLGRASSQFHLDLLLYGATLGVSYAFSYYGRYRERERRAAHLEAQLAQAQLQALKMQLHPHFLFNTLNAIAGLVRDERNKAAVDMLAGLSDLLRYTLENAGRQEVPLREELGFLELYLNIQQMRFSDRLCVELQVAPDTLDALVPNLILQPLVENAIRHGVGERARAGTVGVTAARTQPNGEARLRLTVYDDGPGLRAAEQRAAAPRTGGVGLANTRARLAQLYGAAQQFTIAERAAGGTEATLVLPFRRSAE